MKSHIEDRACRKCGVCIRHKFITARYCGEKCRSSAEAARAYQRKKEAAQ